MVAQESPEETNVPSDCHAENNTWRNHQPEKPWKKLAKNEWWDQSIVFREDNQTCRAHYYQNLETLEDKCQSQEY